MINLIFGSKENIAKLSEPMEKYRYKVFEEYNKQNQILLMKSFKPTQKNKIEIILDRGKTTIEEWKLHSARSALLQSRYPDEQRTLFSITNIKPEKFKFDPGIYQYGGLYLYSCGLALKLSEIIGLLNITSDIKYYFLNTTDTQKIFLIPKILGGFIASISIFIAFLIGYKFFNIKSGIITASLFAFLPSIIFEAHCFKPYAFFIPFMLISIYFSMKSYESDIENFKKNIFFSAFFAGLSAGAIILSGYILLSTILAYLFFKRKNNLKIISLDILLIPLGFFISFLITNPYYITSFNKVRDQILFNSSRLPWILSAKTIYKYFFYELYKLYGIPLYLIYIISLLFSFIKRKHQLLILSIPLILFYLYAGNINWDWTIAHYSMVTIPPSLLLTGYFINYTGEKVKWNKIYSVIIAIILFFTFTISIYYHFIIVSNEKNIINSGKWIAENIPANSHIGTSEYPYFTWKSYPPFSIFKYKINEIDKSDYFIINDVEDERMRDKKLFENEFFKGYTLIKKFKRPAIFFDKIYGNMLKNNAFIFFEQNFLIYKRNEKNNR